MYHHAWHSLLDIIIYEGGSRIEGWWRKSVKNVLKLAITMVAHMLEYVRQITEAYVNFSNKAVTREPGMVACAINPSTQEAEAQAGRSVSSRPARAT